MKNKLLLTACRYNNLKAVIGLLQMDADPNYYSSDRDDTPLIMAARHTNDEIIINLLMEHGANIECVDEKDYTALMHAAKWNVNSCVVTTLLKKHLANVNHKSKIDGMTPLMVACQASRNYRTVFNLLEDGAIIHEKSSEGKTALDYLKSNHHLQLSSEYNELKQLLSVEAHSYRSSA